MNQTVEKPYARAVHFDFWLGPIKVCFRCFGLLPREECLCPHCPLAWYCSAQCRADDYLEHEWECVVMRGASAGERERLRRADLRLVARLFTLFHGVHQSPTRPAATGFPNERNIEELMSHAEKWEETFLFHTQWSDFQLLYQGPHIPITSPFLNVDREAFLDMFGKVQTNTFEVWGLEDVDKETENLGNALYLQSSRFDHSCQPTLRRYFDGDGLVLTPVHPGLDLSSLSPQQFADLTITYIYSDGTMAPTSERKENLLIAFNFLCQCPKCEDKESNLFDWGCTKHLCPSCRVPLVPDTHGERSMRDPAEEPWVCLELRDEEVELDLVCGCGHSTTIVLAHYARAACAAMRLANLDPHGGHPVFQFPPKELRTLESELAEAEEMLHPEFNAWLFIARRSLLQVYRSRLANNAAGKQEGCGLGEGEGAWSAEVERVLALGESLTAGFERFSPLATERTSVCGYLATLCRLIQDHRGQRKWLTRCRDLWLRKSHAKYRMVLKLDSLIASL